MARKGLWAGVAAVVAANCLFLAQHWLHATHTDRVTLRAEWKAASGDDGAARRERDRVEWFQQELQRFYDSVSTAKTKFKSDRLSDLVPPPAQWGAQDTAAELCVVTAARGAKYERKGGLSDLTIAQHSYANKQLYAAVHGYDVFNLDLQYFQQISESPLTQHARLLVWAKIPVLYGCLLRYKMCMWVDADVAITNTSIPFQSFFDVRPNTDMVIGKTFETQKLNDPLVSSSNDDYRLNTGIVMMRASTWAFDFLQRVWDMEGIPDSGKRAYIEGINHEQSTMSYFMEHNLDDLAHTFFPAHQQINIHNSISGHDVWKKSDFLVHYYGNFQGCGPRPETRAPSTDGCIDEFIAHCVDAAEAAPDTARLKAYPQWQHDKELMQKRLSELNDGHKDLTRALQPTASASSENSHTYRAAMAVDGTTHTRWVSGSKRKTEWLLLSFPTLVSVCRVWVSWEVAFSSHYQVEIWDREEKEFVVVVDEQHGHGGGRHHSMEDHECFETKRVRVTMLTSAKDGNPDVFSVWEIAVFGDELSADGP